MGEIERAWGMETAGKSLLPIERMGKHIFLIRGKKVMIDADLAMLYGVTTKQLNRQVNRDIDRFPSDFMFELTPEEKSERVTICDRLRKPKCSQHLYSAFTGHGAFMLADVLNNRRAIQAHLLTVRTFVSLRELPASKAELPWRLDALEEKYEKQFKVG